MVKMAQKMYGATKSYGMAISLDLRRVGRRMLTIAMTVFPPDRLPVVEARNIHHTSRKRAKLVAPVLICDV